MNGVIETLRTAWAERSAREQWLLAGLSAIILILVLWYLLVSPLMGFRNEARAAYVDSVERYRSLSAGIARYEVLYISADLRAASDNRPLRTIVAERAADLNLSLSRMVPDDQGRLNVWTESAEAPRLMQWLADLEQQHAIVAIRATINREGSGMARAQIVLERSGGG